MSMALRQGDGARLLRVTIAAGVGALVLMTGAARAEVVTLTPVKDNSIFSSFTGNSNGAGDGLFCGRTGTNGGHGRLRPLMQFDVASAIPAGATITNVKLTLFLRRAGFNGEGAEHTLHRLVADWGEGTSAADGGTGAPATRDDATWSHRFWPDVMWANDGGDFISAASAMAIVDNVSGPYEWLSTPGLIADVQFWLDYPAQNFGWLMIGNEDESWTAKKFASRQFPLESEWPQLQIEFEAGASCTGDIDNDGDVDFDDFTNLLASFGPCPDCPADLDGDDDVDFDDFTLLLANFGPCP